MSTLGFDLGGDLGGDGYPVPEAFSDSFSGTTIDPTWVVGTTPPTIGSGVATFTHTAGTDGTALARGSTDFPLGLSVGDSDFYLQFKLASLSIVTGSQATVFGVGIVALEPVAVTLTPIVEFGGVTTGSVNTYFSTGRGSNEVGDRWTTGSTLSPPILVRVVRTDSIISSAYSADGGTTWVEWDAVNPQRTVTQRSSDAALTQFVALYIRTAHAIDSAGLSAAIDDVYFTSWDRWANALTVGNLYARSWPSGGRIDLSWTNTPAGSDEQRSITIVRSQLAPAELAPPDLVVEPEPLVDIDCTAPAPMWLPTSADEWKQRYPSVPLPTVYWRTLFDPGNVVDSVTSTIGSGTLTKVNAASVRLGTAVGINTGSLRRYVAPELIDTGSQPPAFVATSTLLDPGSNNSIAVYAVFRIARFAGATRSIISNIDAANTSGWYLTINAAGQLAFTVRGSVTATQLSSMTTYADGAWHAVLCVIDWTSGFQAMWTDIETIANGSALPVISATTRSFRVGTSLLNTSAHMQVLTVIGWEGVSSFTVRQTAAASLFTHGALPFSLPDGVTATYTRSGLAAGRWGWSVYDVPDEQVAKFADNRLWFQRNTRYAHPGQLEAAFDVAVTNKASNSESLTGLTLIAATAIDFVNEDPQGLSTAVTLTQTAVDGRAFFSATGLTVGVQHWVTLYLRSESGGHKVTIWVRDGADSTANVNTKVVVYVQPYWRRFTVPVTTTSSTSLGVRVYGGVDGVDTNKAVSLWGRAIYESSAPYAPSYVPTNGVSGVGTRGATTMKVNATQNGAFYSAAFGEARSKFSRYANSIGGSNGFVFNAQRSGGASTDLRCLFVNTSDAVVFQSKDGLDIVALSATSTVRAPGTEPLEARCDWRDPDPVTGAGSNHAKLFVNATDTATAWPSTFSPSTGVDQVVIGAATTSGTQMLRGGVAYVRFYAQNPSCDGSVTPYKAGLDPLGKVLYSGVPIGAPGAAASFTDAGLTEGVFYYYSVFPSRVPPAAATFVVPMSSWQRLMLSPGDTDVGPVAPTENRVGGLALIDRVAVDGKRFYGEFPQIYRVADEEDRKAQGRVTGLLDDLSTFLQRGVDHAHTLAIGMRSVNNPRVGPIGMVGTAHNQTAIADAFLRQFSVNPDAVGLLGSARRRLWESAIGILKRKATLGAVHDYVQLITGWSSVAVTQPSIDVTARYFRTWDGETSLRAIDVPATSVTRSAGSFTISGLGLTPDKYVGGVYIDWFGNLLTIAGNTDTTVTFDDATFVAEVERVYIATVTGTNNVQLPVSVNDDQYNRGFVHETGLGAAVAIVDTLSSTSSVTTAGGLTNGSNQVAISAAYTGNFASRVPRFRAWLWDGEHSGLYDPGADLSLRGTQDDPFYILFPGLAPTGSGASFPVTDDDVVVWAPVGASRIANRRVLWLSDDGTQAILAGSGPNVRPGDYVNPNRNQSQWFRITEVYDVGPSIFVSVSLDNEVLSLRDVAALYDLATIVARQTLEHDRAVRSMVPAIMPVNGRVFVYYVE